MELVYQVGLVVEAATGGDGSPTHIAMAKRFRQNLVKTLQPHKAFARKKCAAPPGRNITPITAVCSLVSMMLKRLTGSIQREPRQALAIKRVRIVDAGFILRGGNRVLLGMESDMREPKLATRPQLASITGANRNTLEVRLRELVAEGRVRLGANRERQ